MIEALNYPLNLLLYLSCFPWGLKTSLVGPKALFRQHLLHIGGNGESGAQCCELLVDICSFLNGCALSLELEPFGGI